MGMISRLWLSAAISIRRASQQPLLGNRRPSRERSPKGKVETERGGRESVKVRGTNKTSGKEKKEENREKVTWK